MVYRVCQPLSGKVVEGDAALNQVDDEQGKSPGCNDLVVGASIPDCLGGSLFDLTNEAGTLNVVHQFEEEELVGMSRLRAATSQKVATQLSGGTMGTCACRAPMTSMVGKNRTSARKRARARTSTG